MTDEKATELIKAINELSEKVGIISDHIDVMMCDGLPITNPDDLNPNSRFTKKSFIIDADCYVK